MTTMRSLLLLVTLALLAGCGPAVDTETVANTLQRALPTDPESLDQHKARSTQSAEVLRDLGEGLVGHSPTGELVPGVAERWEVSADGLTYTFHLRDNAKWSNGDAVTAAHFVAGMQRLVDPATAAFYAEFLADVSEASAPDERTLVLTLERPTPYLLNLLTHPATFPVHPPTIAEHGDDFARPGRLVSNGPYRLEARVPGSIIALRRNEHYWNDAATAIDAVNYHVVVQDTAELNRYRAGELHVTSTVPTENFAQVRETYGDQLHIAQYLGVYYYGLNLNKPPFRGNRPLRQALSMAIDREFLANQVIGRGEVPAYSWVPPAVNDYEPPVMSFASFDRDERETMARRLYKEAGYGPDNPLRVELRYNTSDAHKKVAVAVQSMWKGVLGVETTLVNEEHKVLLANMREAEITQVFRSSWIGDYNDAHTFLSVLRGGAPSNMPRYASDQFDDLLNRAATQPDLERRRLHLEEAERVMLADHPVIPLYFYVSKHLVSPRVSGWGDNVLDYHYSHHLSLSAPD